MSSYYQTTPGPSMPKPSKPLKGILVGLLAIWMAFAIGINWGGASREAFALLAGNTQAIADGQVWRLLTAPLLHLPETAAGVQHIAFSLLGLYFLGAALEQNWGTPRLIRFLATSAVFSYFVQWLLDMAAPAAFSARMVPPYWYGTTPVLAALAIAFSLSLRDQKVLLFFVLPVGSRALVLATVGFSVLLVLADAMGPSGHLAPFAGMLAGWIFGGGTPSPARRWWLRFRIGRLDAAANRSRPRSATTKDKRRFEVISGGRDDTKDRRRGGGGLLH